MTTQSHPVSSRATVATLAAALSCVALAACGTQGAPTEVDVSSPSRTTTSSTTSSTTAGTPATSTGTASGATSGTAATAPSASSSSSSSSSTPASALPGSDCLEYDANGDPVWHGNPSAAADRAQKEQDALNTVPLKEVAGGAACSDGKRMLIASSTFTTRRVRPNGDIEMPLPRPLYQLIDAQGALGEKYHATSVGFDVARPGYVVGGQWATLPADTVVDGVTVHFVHRGPASAMSSATSSATSSPASSAASSAVSSAVSSAASSTTR